MSDRHIFISTSLVSNRPHEFTALLDNYEQMAYDPKRVEIIVRIDDKDEAMQQLVRAEQKRRDLKLKFLSMPFTGFLELYKSFDEMHYKLCDPNAYFVQHINDELRHKTKHWDKILEDRYVGLFEDNIYRLRISLHKLWNYHSIYEAAPHPENIPIVTKKWIDLTGWCPCHSADSFQQMLAYYLGMASDAADRVYRDIPIFDVEMGGLEAGIGLETPEEKAAHQKTAEDGWKILFSQNMQYEANKKANILRAHVKAHKLGKSHISVTHSQTATHVFDNESAIEIMTFPMIVEQQMHVQSAPVVDYGRAIPLCIRLVRILRKPVSLLKRIFS